MMLLSASPFVIGEALKVTIVKASPELKNVDEIELATTTSTYSVIESQQFEEKHEDLAKLIEHETGVQIRSSGGQGSFSTVSLRGATSEQVTVYLDGVLLNQASGGAVDLSLIPLANVERIEIYRGSVPIELGNASLGGAVNIISKIQSKEGLNLKASVGSYNTQSYSVSSSTGYDKNDIVLSIESLTSDNDFEIHNDNGTPLNPADDRNEPRFNNALAQTSLMAKWRYQINKHNNVSAKVEYLDKKKELPHRQNNPLVEACFDTRDYDFITQLNSRSLFDGYFDTNFKIYLHHKDELFNDELAQIGLLGQKIVMESDKKGGELFSSIKFDTSQVKYRMLLEEEAFEFEDLLTNQPYRDNDRKLIEQGLEYKSFYFEGDFIFNISVRNIYVHDSVSAVQDTFGNPIDIGERKYTENDYQLGSRYRFNAQSSLNLNAAEYVRIPSFFELFGNLGFFRGSPDLLNEEGVNIDLGHTYTWYAPGAWLHDAQLYLGVFRNQISNLIVRDYNSFGVGVSKNVADADINGVEFNFKIYPGAFSVFFNASLIRSVNSSDVAAYDSKSLPGHYEQDYNLYLSYAVNSWQFSADWDVKKTMYYDRVNLLQAPDISNLNFSILNSSNNNSVEFSVKNALDKKAMDFQYQPAPGISYYLTYNQKF
ncbi:MAG: TonB-dependent receptor plug domain-containing protein [Gammaproteobacteria bacterium]|nr:TonB-dependent receptor plug domain-containing protein [Gammaproteobacteria bacterium]